MSTRREFITGCGKLVTSVTLGVALLPLLESCEPTSIPALPTGPIQPPGSDGRIGIDVSDLNASNPTKLAPGLVGSDQMSVLITRISATDYRALSTYCPHAGCQVETTVQHGEIPCFCHGSLFGLDGAVHKGPSVAPLKPYDSIYVAASNQIRIKLT